MNLYMEKLKQENINIRKKNYIYITEEKKYNQLNTKTKKKNP